MGKLRSCLRHQIVQNDVVPETLQQNAVKARGGDQEQPQTPSHDRPHRHLQRHSDDVEGAAGPAAGAGKARGERGGDRVRGGGG